MSVLLFILGVAVAFALTILRALAVDEIRGRVQRRIVASVEATIASLPEELRAEWADEWRSELASVISMPIEAIALARGLRKSASQLITDPIFAPAVAEIRPQQHGGQTLLRHLRSVPRHVAKARKIATLLIKIVSNDMVVSVVVVSIYTVVSGIIGDLLLGGVRGISAGDAVIFGILIGFVIFVAIGSGVQEILISSEERAQEAGPPSAAASRPSGFSA